ncbi:MAG: hypothetical protein ACKVT0_23110 [Planctomycetaceae bacterium]
MSELKTADRACLGSNSPRTTRWCIVAVVVGAICVWTNSVFADEPSIVRIEEDWVVEVSNPEEELSSPQIITSMSSTDELADVHAIFELNHRTLPEYAAGGMGLQLWSNDTNLENRWSPKTASLSFEDETIYYTMRMELQEGNIDFEVRNGYSTTWSSFGNYGYLKVGTTTTQTSLSQYDPEVSVANSRIAFAKHRVQRFGILRVRYYTHDNQLVDVDYTDRMVHILSDEE